MITLDTTGCPSAGTIQLHSGRYVDPLNLRPEEIDLDDIAHALANISRFSGHAARFYSVAEHSLLVAELAPDSLRLEALLHDAAEAYLGDLARPLKVRPEFRFFREAEADVQATIEVRFGLCPGVLDCEEIRTADNLALAVERRDLMPPNGEWPGRPEPPEDAVARYVEPENMAHAYWLALHEALGLRAGATC